MTTHIWVLSISGNCEDNIAYFDSKEKGFEFLSKFGYTMYDDNNNTRYVLETTSQKLEKSRLMDLVSYRSGQYVNLTLQKFPINTQICNYINY